MTATLWPVCCAVVIGCQPACVIVRRIGMYLAYVGRSRATGTELSEYHVPDVADDD